LFVRWSLEGLSIRDRDRPSVTICLTGLLIVSICSTSCAPTCTADEEDSVSTEASGLVPQEPCTCPAEQRQQVSCEDDLRSFVGADIEISTNRSAVTNNGRFICDREVYLMRTPLSSQRLNALAEADESATVSVCGRFSGGTATGPERALWFNVCGFAVNGQQD